ncbi:hypothetical protein CCAX7_61140 [Capsulimonas corticalis]|uniref:Uncharacterized protein n=1 Tax=Capsulimonas corticalis TaxID=2219043 RepID=A0A402CW64_9BACT|nr:metalloregulator ArsR/SmtB family transcription factor [Capsulimonas corticalis]BDI34063.1 hypothetical protein CCAX7_61140 [Capsulimonas corticalis]
MKSATRQRAAQQFGALSHPKRLKIVELLCVGEKSVNEIAREINFSQSGTSQHLAILTHAGLLVLEAHGATRVYRVRGPRVGQILALMEEFCETHELYGVSEEKTHGEWTDAPDGESAGLSLGNGLDSI